MDGVSLVRPPVKSPVDQSRDKHERVQVSAKVSSATVREHETHELG